MSLEEVDERLKEWAHYFRDRRHRERCRSIEHRFQPHSEDFAAEGWGDMEAPPREPKQVHSLLRAIEMHEKLMQLPKIQKWAVTYAFCYPGLPRGLVLRCMKKWVGKPVSWRVYEEQVELAKFRIYVCLKNN